MNVSVQHLLAAVSSSLEREVLPHLDPQAFPAGNLRACLMLLANIEARVTHEARNVFDDNGELRVLLQEAADRGEELGLKSELRQSVLAALGKYPQAQWFDTQAMADENRDYQELLTHVIEQSSGHHSPTGEFRGKLHAYLQRLGLRDMQLVANALQRTPI